MSRSPDEKSKPDVPATGISAPLATEPVKGCATCGRASNTMYSEIVSADDGVARATTKGPFCQACWDKRIR